MCGALLGACAKAAPAAPERLAPLAVPQDEPAPSPPPFAAPHPHFDALVKKAAALVKEPARDAAGPALPRALLSLDWNGYRNIEYRAEQGLWDGERFSAQFFHPGYIYRHPVQVFTIDGERIAPFGFSPKLFSYANGVQVPPDDAGLGFAGMRLHTPLNSPDGRDELIVFQGASYFRPLARGLYFGLSGRGLAIGTGEPAPEEFPRFSELYLVHPQSGDEGISVLALLESARATGAYAFRVTPAARGKLTWVDVTAQIFLREPVSVLGLAPLTSMYLFGKDEPGRFGDFRPEVHDSDALVMQSGSGERVVRPLENPPRTKVSTFRLDSPRGFGLVQRERGYDAYGDLVERYQDRPSAYIEPQGDWGKGAVRMQEMATPLETDDNIAVMWVPDSVPPEGLKIAYRMHVAPDMPGVDGFGHAVATRLTRTDPLRTRMYVDFALPSLPSGGLEVEVSATGAEVKSRTVVPNGFVHGVRAIVDLERSDATRDVELRAFVRQGEHALTETWSYRWPGKS